MSLEWGAMVQPGVYMIQKPRTCDALAEIVKKDGSLNYELIYLEIEEISTHIEKLKASNVEIQNYICQQGRPTQEGGDENENCMLGLAREGSLSENNAHVSDNSNYSESDDESEEEPNNETAESDLDVFREALLENENVIYKQEKELELLTRLVKDQKCGCSFHTHGQHSATPASNDDTTSAAATAEPAPHGRITL